MAGYKETPRQKMIGMMYLVLTALLALNVSKQILDAFIVVNESMELTNSNFSKKLSNTYSKFESQYNSNPAKVGPYWMKAVQAHKLSNDLEKFVDSLKFMVIMKTEKLESYDSAKILPLNKAKRVDNYDIPTNYFIGSSEDGSAGQARVLKLRIEQYKKQMLDLVDPKMRNTIKMGLETEGTYLDANKKTQNWEMHNFYRTILAATVTILNKIKAEVYNAEFDVVNHLFSAISAEDYKFDAIQAKVIPKSRFVFSGEEYEAEILVAAYETKGQPTVRYQMGTDSLTPGQAANARVLEGENGRVTLKLAASGEGMQRYAGFIEMLDPSGVKKQYHFNEVYNVAKPLVTISPTKMNVFYVGVDNPIDISVPGAPERITPTVSVGSIKPAVDGKGYVVYNLPKNTKDAVVNVSAVFDGKPRNMGSFTFRLKRVPDPIAKIGGKNEGFISRSLLMTSPYLIPEMPVGFDFALSYVVVSCNFGTFQSGDVINRKITGNRLSDEIVKIIKEGKKNQRIWFEDIIVKGPDGERTIGSVNLKVN
jgi:gliding motility-associated protein GldM